MKKAIFFTASCTNDKENEFESCRGEGRISINTAFGFSLLGYECYIVNNYNLKTPKKIWNNVYIINTPNENEIYDIAFSWDFERLNGKNYKHRILITYADATNHLKRIKEQNLDIILVCNVASMMHDPENFNYQNTQYLPTPYPVPSISIGFIPYKFKPKLPELNVLLYHSSWESTIARSKYYLHKQQLIINILKLEYKLNLFILIANEKLKIICPNIYNLSGCNEVHYIDNEKIRYDDIIKLISSVDLCLLVGALFTPGPLVVDAISLGKPMLYVLEGAPRVYEFNPNELCKCMEYVIPSTETDDISIRKIKDALNNPEKSFNSYRKVLEDHDFKNWKMYTENFLIKNCGY